MCKSNLTKYASLLRGKLKGNDWCARKVNLLLKVLVMWSKSQVFVNVVEEFVTETPLFYGVNTLFHLQPIIDLD